MKTIFIALIIACVAFSASAQSVNSLFQNQVNSIRLQPLKIDTSLNKLVTPKLPGVGYNGFNLPLATTAPLAHLPGFPDALVVYSNMPVKHLQSTDNMPIAGIDAAGYSTSIKRVLINP